MPKRIERLAGLAPTDAEFQKGSDLRGVLMELTGVLHDSRLSTLDGEVGLNPEPGDHVLVFPTDWINRWLTGTRETINGTHPLTPIETKTRQPFIVNKFIVTGVGYSRQDLPDEVPMVRGTSPLWDSWPNNWTRDELHYEYVFDLAKHTLAVINHDRTPFLFEDLPES